MKEKESTESEEVKETNQQKYSDEYCDTCECDPCDCSWGTDQ